MTTVLVADSDRHDRRRAAAALRFGGYDVESTGTISHLNWILRYRPLDALVLNPTSDHREELIAEVRVRTDAAIVVVSDRLEEREKVALLDAGADDYLTKPFGVEELLARVRAVLRRARIDHETPVVTSDFTIDLADRRFVATDGHEVRLTPTEWKVVEILVRRPGHLVEQAELLTIVWGPDAATKTNSLRVFMTTIRRKVEPEPAHPRYFITVPGLGLRFDPSGTPPISRPHGKL